MTSRSMLAKIYEAVLFFIYKLHQWSERSEPAAPMLGVTFAVSMFNALALLSIANLVFVMTGKDALSFFLLFKSRWQFAPVVIGWMLLHYALIEFTGLKRKAIERFAAKRLREKSGKYVLLAIGVNVAVLILSAVFYLRVKF